MSKPHQLLKPMMRLLPHHQAAGFARSAATEACGGYGLCRCEGTGHSRQHYGVDLFGPTREDYHWQAREGTGCAASQFVHWQHECATCPAGKSSISWSPVHDRRGNPVIKIKFAVQDCRSCPLRELCTRTQSTSPRRTLTIRPHSEYMALQAARQRQATTAFKTTYNKRAGIEGTLSQSIRVFGLRHARYRGMTKSICKTS